MAAGFDDYLSKPIDADRLEEMMMEYLPEEKICPAEEEECISKMSEQFQESSCIDVEKGMKNSGDAEGYLRVLKLFDNSLEERYEELEQLYREENIKDFTIKVHSLKSSAKIVGATELGEHAQLLEDAGKSGDTEYIRSHYEGFMKEYKDLWEPLRTLIASMEEEKNRLPELDVDMRDAVLGALKLAVEDEDPDVLDTIFEELSDFTIPAAEEEFWKNMRAAYEAEDFAGMRELLQSM